MKVITALLTIEFLVEGDADPQEELVDVVNVLTGDLAKYCQGSIKKSTVLGVSPFERDEG